MKNHNLNFLELVDSSLKYVGDIHEVKSKLENKEEFFLFDVREDREWIQGHIKDAEHLGKGIIERDIGSMVVDKTKLIVLYCQGGFRSALAGENLKKMGYENILSMKGGYSDWLNHNFPIDKP